MFGFGEKSFQRLMDGIEKSRQTTMPRILYALGIPGIGAANARVLCDHFGDDVSAIAAADTQALAAVEGIGPVLAASVAGWFSEVKNRGVLERLLRELHPAKKDKALSEIPSQGEPAVPDPIAGKTFVVTGRVTRFANRDELKEYIADRGGKVAGSVSAKTDYLINNDVTSTSSKNKKAAQLGIPILSEEDFLKLAGEQ